MQETLEENKKGDWDGFLGRADECRKAVERMKSPLLVNHYDCDGLTSGSIVCAFLEQRGVPYRVNTVRKLDAAVIEEIKNEKEIIFTDLGGGQKGVNELQGDVVIFDHHQTEGVSKLQLNPQLFGFDGGTELCGATTTYWGLRTLPEVAIVGAIGDIQYPLKGPNRILLDELVAKGIVNAQIDIRFYGRMSRPLPQLLAYADDPFLPGLGGNEERCAQFLENLGIKKSTEGKWPTYSQLDSEVRKTLVGAIATYLAEYSHGNFRAEKLVGETYLFPKYSDVDEMYDAGEFSTMMNACGRHDQPQVGMDVCLGREGAIEKARTLLEFHRRQLREGVDFAYRQARDYGSFLFLDGRGVIDDGIIGVVAGMLYPGGRQKAIVAIAYEKSGKIKISTRGTKALVAAGLNLGMALNESCPKVGGVGGGHRIAAGASIPPDKLDEFLSIFADTIKKQLEAKRTLSQ